jgi:hypothetical protein
MELLQSREESLFQGSTSWCKRLKNLAVDVQHYKQAEMSAPGSLPPAERGTKSHRCNCSPIPFFSMAAKVS